MTEQKIPLLVVTGPTASGKTRLAVELCLQNGGEVVSADSMQVYRGMAIGTAKPTPEEMQGVPHHLLDFLEPEQSFSVAEYVALAHKEIADIARRGRLPVLCGGTGLYISALVDHLEFTRMERSPQVRAELEALVRERGNQAAWEELRACDPKLAATLHPNNIGRILRALEVYRLTGVPMSQHQAESRRSPSPYALCMLGLTFADRQLLYRRIEARVEEMLAAGLLEELQALSARALSPTAQQAIGYKEFAAYRQGEETLPEAVARLKMQTRRYAKRQLSWLRRDGRIEWIYCDKLPGYNEVVRQAQELLDRSGIWRRESRP